VKDRRSVFFLVAAVVAALMAPLSEPDLRWVPEVLAVTYVILAILSFLDFESRRRGSLRRAFTHWVKAPRRIVRRRRARAALRTRPA
jgi:predicted Na+-dependent transporter